MVRGSMIAPSQLNVVAMIVRTLAPALDERLRRLLLGAGARALGHGGINAVAEIAGVSRDTVSMGMWELQGGPAQPSARVRRPGGGRKLAEETDATLLADLDGLVSPDTRGDPMSPLRWTCKSLRQLTATLKDVGHRQVNPNLVRRLLKEQGYSLQRNVKVMEGAQHPARDAQFNYLNEQVKEHQAQGAPVISVDTKKKELVGEFKNEGREWEPEGQPQEVNVHDFPDAELGKAIPYGLYDVTRNAGWVSVGQDHDTASFAVEAVRRWWTSVGRSAYAGTHRLLICADRGGSNGYQSRLWKKELMALAEEMGTGPGARRSSA